VNTARISERDMSFVASKGRRIGSWKQFVRFSIRIVDLPTEIRVIDLPASINANCDILETRKINGATLNM
jgi:hypothetical protein